MKFLQNYYGLSCCLQGDFEINIKDEIKTLDNFSYFISDYNFYYNNDRKIISKEKLDDYKHLYLVT